MATYSFFPANPTPAATQPGDSAVELGTAFNVTEAVQITAWHWYQVNLVEVDYFYIWEKTALHVGTARRKQASGLAGAQSGSGWKEITLTTPLEVVPGKTYVASFHTPNGFYGVDAGKFTSAGVTNGPIHAWKDEETDSIGKARNGAYLYNSEGGNTASEGSTEKEMPSEHSFGATFYGIDIVAKSLAVVQELRPDEDLVTTGWTETPLFSKINDSSDATAVRATLS